MRFDQNHPPAKPASGLRAGEANTRSPSGFDGVVGPIVLAIANRGLGQEGFALPYEQGKNNTGTRG